MVIINTQINKKDYSSLEFKYLLEVPRSECVFCSTKDKITGRTRLFLIFNNQNRIYERNGLKGTWEEVTGAESYREIRRILALAINKVPYYTTNRFDYR